MAKRSWFGIGFNCPTCGLAIRKRNQRGRIQHTCKGCKAKLVLTVEKVCGLGYRLDKVELCKE